VGGMIGEARGVIGEVWKGQHTAHGGGGVMKLVDVVAKGRKGRARGGDGHGDE
jgi:hypothetical protein